MNLLIWKDVRLPHIPSEWILQANYHRTTTTPSSLLTLQDEQGVVLSISQTEERIKAEIQFDAREVPIVLLAELPDAENISLLISNSKSWIALYLNQKLCDEDWPLGSVPLENCICIECAANVSLHDDFLVEQQYLLNRSLPLIANIQNWKPDGLNTGVGDCMPFSHDGTLHLFYLFDRRGHASKWGLGAHQWAHVSTTDLRTWQQHPLAISISRSIRRCYCEIIRLK